MAVYFPTGLEITAVIAAYIIVGVIVTWFIVLIDKYITADNNVPVGLCFTFWPISLSLITIVILFEFFNKILFTKIYQYIPNVAVFKIENAAWELKNKDIILTKTLHNYLVSLNLEYHTNIKDDDFFKNITNFLEIDGGWQKRTPRLYTKMTINKHIVKQSEKNIFRENI